MMRRGTTRRGALRTAVAAMAAAALLLLSGCVGDSSSADESAGAVGDKYSGEIEWWTINLRKNYAAYIDGMITEYQGQHPDVKINWVDVPGQEITTKLLAAITAGKVPDAVNFTGSTVGLFGNSMADLNDLFSEQEIAAYAPSLVTPLRQESGKLAAVPFYNGGTKLGIYRLSALKRVGFDPKKPPSTWDEALALAQKVADSGGGYGMNAMAYTLTMQSEGIALISPDRKTAAFNTPEAVAVLEKFKRHLDSKAIAPGVLGKDNRIYPQNLTNKQIAFDPAITSSELVGIEKNAPDVYADLAVVPAVTGATGKQFMPDQQVFGVPAASDNKAAAAEWIKFVTSSKNQLAFCKLVPVFPGAAETAQDPFFTNVAGDTANDQGRRVLAQEFPKATDASFGSTNDEALREMFDEQVRAYMMGSKTASAALTDAEKQWNDELAKAR